MLRKLKMLLYSAFTFAIALVLIAMPAFATPYTTTEFTKIDISGNSRDEIDPVLFDAYIDFSEQLSALGISPKTCYEDFVYGYQCTINRVLQFYVEMMVETEIVMNATDACKETNFDADYLYSAIEQAITIGAVSNEEIEIVSTYKNLLRFFNEREGNIILTYDDFFTLYKMSSNENPQEYVDQVIQQFDAATNNNSRLSMWYDNLGTSSPKLPQSVTYSTYNLLETVKKGDIVYETNGGIALLTGHIAVVEGTFYDTTQKQCYIRLIESGTSGVVYGVLDDTRYEYRGIRIYRVTSATTSNISGAVNFCISQLGKPYNWVVATVNPNGPIEPGSLGKCSTESAPCWYCSELVWAAYYRQGINLHGSTIPDNIYYPVLLVASPKVSLISKYK